MAMTNATACGFCRNSTGTAIEENLPVGSNFKIFQIRCLTCGAILGVLDFVTTGELYEEISKLKKAMNIR